MAGAIRLAKKGRRVLWRPVACRRGVGRGLERRDGGWWPRFTPEVMIRTLREAARRPHWQHWEMIACPTLLVRAGKGVLPTPEAPAASRRKSGEVNRPRRRSRQRHYRPPSQRPRRITRRTVPASSTDTRSADAPGASTAVNPRAAAGSSLAARIASARLASVSEAHPRTA
jgi:hypothetical protein